jgi:hypothetical protein
LEVNTLNPVPDVGSPTDLDSAIVVCALFPVPDAPAPEVPFSYAALRRPETTLIPLEWARHMTTTQIVVAADPSSERIRSPRGGSLHRFSEVTYHEEVCDDRAPGMRFATLMVGGPRRFDYEGRSFQCFIRWSSFNGSRLMPRDHFLSDTPEIHRLAIRHAAGCLYARIRDYDDRGQATGYRTLVVCIETSLLHGPPDNLFMQMWSHVLRHEDPKDGNVILPSFLAQGRPMFKELRYRSEIGFNKFCTEDQMGEAGRAALTFSGGEEAFLAQIEGLAWEAAIDLVEEPWQLYIICRDIQPPEFARRKTAYKQAKLMVETYCDQHPDRAGHIRVLWAEVSNQVLADQDGGKN